MLIFSPRNMASIFDLQPAFGRQLQEKTQRFSRNSILGVVEKDAFGLCRHSFAAAGVLFEQLAKMQLRNGVVMGLKVLSRFHNFFSRTWIRSFHELMNDLAPSS